MPRDKVRLTSSKDTAGSATFGAMSPLFPMQLSSSLSGRGVPGLSLIRGDARGPMALLLGLALLAMPQSWPARHNWPDLMVSALLSCVLPALCLGQAALSLPAGFLAEVAVEWEAAAAPAD